VGRGHELALEFLEPALALVAVDDLVRAVAEDVQPLARRGSKLVLLGPGPLVGQALKHSAIHEIIPVSADLDGALALLRS